MASLAWIVHRPTRAWQVAVTGLAVLPATAVLRHLIKPEAGDAWGWGLFMAVLTTVAGAAQLLRGNSKDDDETRDNLPPYGGDWPPAH